MGCSAATCSAASYALSNPSVTRRPRAAARIAATGISFSYRGCPKPEAGRKDAGLTSSHAWVGYRITGVSSRGYFALATCKNPRLARVTRVERYAGHCPCCDQVSLAPVPEGLEPGTPFSVNILALAIYLRFTHAISYQRLSRLFLHLFALQISEGALDAIFRRAKPCFDNEVAAILARLRRSRIICSDETTVRIDGRTHWNWVFQNQQVVIHVIRNSRAASVVADVLDGHRPSIWVSDLYSAQQGHADLWQICLAHQLRDCQYAIEAGDEIFAPRMKTLLLRAVVLARRRMELAESTRRSYQRRLDRDLNAIMVLAPANRHGKRLRKRYGRNRSHLFTFLDHPDTPPDNNGSERELRPTATYRKVTGGFRSNWGADLFAAVRSVVGTAARHGTDAYQAINAILGGASVLKGG